MSGFNMHLLDTIGEKKKIFLFSLQSGQLHKLSSAVNTPQIKPEQKSKKICFLIAGKETNVVQNVWIEVSHQELLPQIYMSADKSKSDYHSECWKMTVLRSWTLLHNIYNCQCLQQKLHINIRSRNWLLRQMFVHSLKLGQSQHFLWKHFWWSWAKYMFTL